MIYTPVSPLLKYEINNMEYNIPAVFQGRFDTRVPNILQNGKSENEKNDNSNNDSDKVLGTIGALCLGALVIGGIMMVIPSMLVSIIGLAIIAVALVLDNRLYKGSSGNEIPSVS